MCYYARTWFNLSLLSQKPLVSNARLTAHPKIKNHGGQQITHSGEDSYFSEMPPQNGAFSSPRRLSSIYLGSET